MRAVSPLVASLIILLISIMLAVYTMYSYQTTINALKLKYNTVEITDYYSSGKVVGRVFMDDTVYYVIEENFTIVFRTSSNKLDLAISYIIMYDNGTRRVDVSHDMYTSMNTSVEAYRYIYLSPMKTKTSGDKYPAYIRIVYTHTPVKTVSPNTNTYMYSGRYTVYIPVYKYPLDESLDPETYTRLFINSVEIYNYHYTLMTEATTP